MSSETEKLAFDMRPKKVNLLGKGIKGMLDMAYREVPEALSDCLGSLVTYLTTHSDIHRLLHVMFPISALTYT